MDAETVAHGSEDANHAHALSGSSVNQIRIGLDKSTIVFTIVLAGAALIMGLNLAKQYQQDQDFRDLKVQYALIERRLMDREAYDILNGFKVPGDDTHGPTGNLQRMIPRR